MARADGLGMGELRRKAMDGEIGPLARAVHREEPEGRYPLSVQVGERFRHQLAGALARGVR